MKIFKIVLPIVAAAAAFGSVCQQAQATPIFGVLHISGTLVTSDTTKLLDNVAVGGGTNSLAFASIAMGSPVVTADLFELFVPFMLPTLFSVGAFTLDLSSPTFNSQQQEFSGQAMLFGPTGYQRTSGASWVLDYFPNDFTFTVISNQGVATADNGMTIALLSGALVCIAAFRAKFVKSCFLHSGN